MAKTPSPTTASTAGTLVTYNFLVTNTGNVNISNIALVDMQAPGT